MDKLRVSEVIRSAIDETLDSTEFKLITSSLIHVPRTSERQATTQPETMQQGEQ